MKKKTTLCTKILWVCICCP